ncbi:MAG: hypothetical protein PSV43_18930, partial [Prosthecobacter sp.]|nr:hypothetical protein [Prosthecobacter sp.]
MPAPAESPVPQWSAPVAAQAPAPSWPPAMQSPMMGEMQGTGLPSAHFNAGVNLNTGLPPKRAPG